MIVVTVSGRADGERCGSCQVLDVPETCHDAALAEGYLIVEYASNALIAVSHDPRTSRAVNEQKDSPYCTHSTHVYDKFIKRSSLLEMIYSVDFG